MPRFSLPFLLTFLGVWLCLSKAWAQAVFRIDSLPVKGIVLDKSWKWQLGDDPAWGRTDFDDAHWEIIDPTQDISTLNKLPQQGIGWLRLHLRVASSMRGQAVAMSIDQVGATEIFLNGQLTGLTGAINPRKRVEVGLLSQHNPFVRLGNDSLQVIAVRYAFSTKRLIKRPYSFFYLRLLTPQVAETYAIKSEFFTYLELVLFGLFIVLGVLQLILYIPASDQRATLYLGLFLVTQGVVHLSDGVIGGSDLLRKGLAISQVALVDDVGFIVFAVSIVLSSFFYLLGSYHYFSQSKKILFFATATLAFTSIPMSLLFRTSYWFLALAILGQIIPFIDILRVGIVAVQLKKPGARLFTIAHAFTLVVYIGWTVITLFPTSSTFLLEYRDYIFALSYIGLALTISFLLAQERVTANKLLRKQFVELEILSQKTLVQEQEKQQLLSTQNERLEQQVEIRTTELKASLESLKATQAQLIQKEKLASLGELTAGIAHEIQNPLNFVNNFSEVSAELIEELKEEAQAGHTEDVLAIADDLTQNLQKIHHHGGRASAIVKGMLAHSRTDSGEKRAANLNALADEYLNIAYHGLKAKDKSFECKLVRDYDSTLGQVELTPQEIGRVLLNLYNNAFYAVRERQQQSGSSYQPTVSVTTARTQAGIQIRVSDNGTGIPESVIAKIFQPFFTTKPTGEGTGLGLSLSYDIVTKGHGGMLRVESQVSEGTTFFIELS